MGKKRALCFDHNLRMSKGGRGAVVVAAAAAAVIAKRSADVTDSFGGGPSPLTSTLHRFTLSQKEKKRGRGARKDLCNRLLLLLLSSPKVARAAKNPSDASSSLFISFLLPPEKKRESRKTRSLSPLLFLSSPRTEFEADLSISRFYFGPGAG